jgi:PEGA domain
MKKGILVLAAALMTLAPTTASAAIRGGVAVGVAPAWHGWYGGWYGGYWGPYYWGPYWGPYYYGYPYAGEVKLETKVKDAQVFINGGYAGTTKESRKMHLRPGNYKIEIREGERTAFSQDVYVAAGKTVHLYPEL